MVKELFLFHQEEDGFTEVFAPLKVKSPSALRRSSRVVKVEAGLHTVG